MNAHAQLATPTQLRLHQERQARRAKERRTAFWARVREAALDVHSKRDQIVAALNFQRACIAAEISNQRRKARAYVIAREVCAARGVSEKEIYGKSKTKRISHARAEIYFNMRERLGWSFERIGVYLGVTHVSVMRGVEKHKERMDLESWKQLGAVSNSIVEGLRK